jgi:protein phosphatase
MSRIIDNANTKIEEERKKANSGALVIKAQGRLIIVGDLHGDLESLYRIFIQTQFIRRAAHGEDLKLIFLGDYGDRGKYSPEVYFVILHLKQTLPNEVLLLRGNHEGIPLLSFSPHDMPTQLEQKYGESWKEIYSKMLTVFSNLPHSAIVENKYLLLHGGVPAEVTSMDDISLADKLFPMTTYFEDILWSDPKEDISGVQPSPRGLGKLFGGDVTSKVLELTKTKSLIRSHEPCEGVKVNHSGKVLTIFSRKGAPYENTTRAFLELDVSLDAKDTYTLAKEATFY